MPREIDFYRRFTKILSTSVFRMILADQKPDQIDRSLNLCASMLEEDSNLTNLDVIQGIYSKLQANYRSEYLYKNLLFKKLLLGKYSLNTATMLNEYKVGKSKADIVLLNGTSVAFEIKTELDNSERLNGQIEDYRKAFAEVNVVTHYTLADKYLELLPAGIGVWSLTKNNTIRKNRTAISSLEHIDTSVVARSMRKQEYSNILLNYYGEIPKVPNTKYFGECLKLLNGIPIEDFHSLMVKELKKRNVEHKDILRGNETPEELKFICYCLDITAEGSLRLRSFLEKKICTYHA